MARTGRPRLENPRNQGVFIRLTEDEHMDIKAYAYKHDLTITQTLVEGFRALQGQERKERTIMQQTIISISREFGSAGHLIAEEIAKNHGLHFYDRRMLDEIANENNIEVEILEKYDEQPRNRLLSRKVDVHSNSMEEILSDLQFEYIRKKAASGESFVIVGRCAETVLKGYKGLITIFVTGDEKCKLKRIMDVYNLSESEAIAKMRRHDRKRKQYHNRHSEFKWGDSRNYDLCINSSKLGIEQTAESLKTYIDVRMQQAGN